MLHGLAYGLVVTVSPMGWLMGWWAMAIVCPIGWLIDPIGLLTSQWWLCVYPMDWLTSHKCCHMGWLMCQCLAYRSVMTVCSMGWLTGL